jgi:hypothetical protein
MHLATRTLLFTSVAAFAFSISALAAQTPATHPDFSGTWLMDTTRTVKTDPSIISLTLRVNQHADTMNVVSDFTTPAGITTANATYGFDGRPWKNVVVQRGIETIRSSVATWEGKSLVIKTTSELQGQTLAETERWTLDASGKTMTKERVAQYAGRTIPQTVVFVRR